MLARGRLLWQGARPLIGTVVGVGIFGLPYVFSRAGYVYGLIELVVIAALSLLTYLLYADLLAVSTTHARFVAMISHQLGLAGRWLASIGFFGALWGAMLAYIIVGGQFAVTALRPLMTIELLQAQIFIWLLASVSIIGGNLFVRRLQAIFIPVFFVMIVALTLFALPNLHFEYLTTFDPDNIFLPFGALIFAFSGFSAIPECRDALGRHVGLMRPALWLGIGLVSVLYGLFCLAIVGLTGPFTSVQAVDGLRYVTDPWVASFVSIIGLLTVFTAFISVGTSLTNSLLYDFRGRFLSSWALVVLVPLIFLLIGARDFIQVIGATGGLLGGLCGLILLIAYERARLTANLPKRALAVPQALVALSFILFIGMMVVTLVELAQ